MRAAIYARYSSDKQQASSIDDQVRLCRERVDREGGAIVEIYTDYAISGSSTINRPGIQSLTADAEAGRFDVVVTEALDRLSRNQADIATLYQRLAFVDVAILTLSEGAVDELHIGLKGTMNALFLKDLAEKVRRGQRGRLEQGRSPGGKSYGYDVVRSLDAAGELVRGGRRINDDQAAIVRRIFTEYGAGRSPREIAARLNADGIPGPRGGRWNASTINGNRHRGNGILNNREYIGEIVYNRQSFRKDPATGRRQARLNPQSDWITRRAPALRIVDDTLWARKEALQRAIGDRPRQHRRRPKRLFSGLLRCGVCGGAYTVMGPDRFGCSAFRESGTCANRQSVSSRIIETRVLDGLKEKLLAPEIIQEAVRAFHQRLAERSRTAFARKGQAEGELAGLGRKVAAIVAAVSDGLYAPEMKSEMDRLRGRRRDLEAELAELADPVVIAMHPDLPARFRQRVEDLQAALNQEATRPEAVAILRSLIDRIVIHPGERQRQFTLELHGELAAILRVAHGQAMDDPEFMERVVAGVGFEPTTFRL